ncbi:DUF2290 domain-containing protein [Vibrio splendidus]|uniref:DUF2290 domain-containing protein n=1 Tax=Vibrio splendidus TaxID=29497 RepID=UPI002469862D|nr:DUF2290 domain-containing protein [Vibrio splendidus]MDH5915108.1 DUF2290 domain-containing protein [Vibrio splendidus]
MSNASYLSSIQRAKKLFNKASLTIHASTPSLPSSYVGRVRGLPYPDEWKIHNEEFWYHIKLADESLILYKPDSFKFLMSPFKPLISIEQFEEQTRQELVEANYTEQEIIQHLEDIQSEYTDFIDTELTKGSYTPIRVDIHPDQYQKTHHPVTHLHIGHDNESRIPIKKIMTPFSFASFVISTFYPEQWKQLRNDELLVGTEYASTNQTLESITKNHNKKWCNEEEEKRFYLT